MLTLKWTFWVGLGASYGALAVIFGAFGAHLLKSKLPEGDLSIFQTATQYHMYHALALLAVGFFSTRIDSQLLNATGWLFAIGTLIFSGSLYLLVITGNRWLGAVTPIGGLLLVLGWILFAWRAFTL
jgi:uncharacterized membrane protein YgdD (TMEM256/DUF423 family)